MSQHVYLVHINKDHVRDHIENPSMNKLARYIQNLWCVLFILHNKVTTVSGRKQWF